MQISFADPEERYQVRGTNPFASTQTCCTSSLASTQTCCTPPLASTQTRCPLSLASTVQHNTSLATNSVKIGNSSSLPVLKDKSAEKVAIRNNANHEHKKSVKCSDPIKYCNLKSEIPVNQRESCRPKYCQSGSHSQFIGRPKLILPEFTPVGKLILPEFTPVGKLILPEFTPVGGDDQTYFRPEPENKDKITWRPAASHSRFYKKTHSINCPRNSKNLKAAHQHHMKTEYLEPIHTEIKTKTISNNLSYYNEGRLEVDKEHLDEINSLSSNIKACSKQSKSLISRTGTVDEGVKNDTPRCSFLKENSVSLLLGTGAHSSRYRDHNEVANLKRSESKIKRNLTSSQNDNELFADECHLHTSKIQDTRHLHCRSSLSATEKSNPNNSISGLMGEVLLNPASNSKDILKSNIIPRFGSTTCCCRPKTLTPIRSKSNLEEFFILSSLNSNGANDESKLLNTSIRLSGCHKNAIRRIESNLLQLKSDTEINALHYDVPRSSQTLHELSHCTKICCTASTAKGNIASVLENTLEQSATPSEEQSSDDDSTATYATIDDARNTDNIELNSNIQASHNKAGKVNIEEKRRTPDIVQCSRCPPSVVSQLAAEQAMEATQQTTVACSDTESEISSSDIYQDISPPTTVINVPIRNVSNFKCNISAEDKCLLKARPSNINVVSAIRNNEEIYSVIEEWPSNTYKNEMKQGRASNKIHTVPCTVELPESKTDKCYNKYAEDPDDCAILDPIILRDYKNEKRCTKVYSYDGNTPRATLVTCSHGTPAKSYKRDNPLATRLTCSHGTPATSHHSDTPRAVRVTVCESVQELCALVAADPSARVYIYQPNAQQNIQDTFQPTDKIIIKR